jgi:hypothetical protein
MPRVRLSSATKGVLALIHYLRPPAQPSSPAKRDDAFQRQVGFGHIAAAVQVWPVAFDGDANDRDGISPALGD